MLRTDLQFLLNERHDRYNNPDFIGEDPIQIPHRYSQKEDIEIAGFLTSLIAWGRRDIIIRNANALLALMDEAPFAYVQSATAKDLKRLDHFVHRTFNGVDAVSMIRGLRKVYSTPGGMEAAFALSPTATDTSEGIVNMRSIILATRGFAPRSSKHIADPTAGASAKRLNMFLRWMVRRDKRGVDFGLWTSMRPDQLICPLDVHTGNVARSLGLLHRKQNDWKAALELTERLREFDPKDPVRYDFSLFGMGVYG